MTTFLYSVERVDPNRNRTTGVLDLCVFLPASKKETFLNGRLCIQQITIRI